MPFAALTHDDLEPVLTELRALRAEVAELRAQNSKSYTVKTLAVYLDCCENKAYLLLADGKIGYTRIGKKGYRISAAAVARYEAGLPPLAQAA